MNNFSKVIIRELAKDRCSTYRCYLRTLMRKNVTMWIADLDEMLEYCEKHDLDGAYKFIDDVAAKFDKTTDLLYN